MPTKLNIRFTVVDASGNASSTWFVASNKSDVYLGISELRDVTKISLHQSGKCHLAFTEKHGIPPSMTGRAYTKWVRSPTPPAGTGSYSRAVVLVFPTDYLGNASHPIKGTVIKAAPPTGATFVEVGFTKDTSAEVARLCEGRRDIIGLVELPNEESVSVTAHPGLWRNRDMLIRSGPNVPADMMVAAGAPPGARRDWKVWEHWPPKHGEPIVMQELTGYGVPRGWIGRPGTAVIRRKIIHTFGKNHASLGEILPPVVMRK